MAPLNHAPDAVNMARATRYSARHTRRVRGNEAFHRSMARRSTSLANTLGGNGGAAAGATIGAAVILLALPSGVLAFATRFDVEAQAPGDSGQIDALRGDGAGTRLARGRSLLWGGRGPEYPFTPAKNPNRPDRLVTVAVRFDSQALKTISGLAERQDASAGSNLRLAQSPFSLGVARGYHNFAQEITSSTVARRADAPDVAKFSIAPGGQRDEPRDMPRSLFDDKIIAGRAPHTFAADKDERVDLGGSVKLTRNLDVTAGVRYSQDRERLLPLTDGKRDNQAVYVGTQLKF
jgi:hypothetical protein